MTRTRRITAALATTAVVGLSLTACGGASGAPDDASADEFCESFVGILQVDPEASAGDRVEDVHDLADDLEETGTPEDIGDDEREGFEVFVDTLADVDEDSIEDLENSEDPGDIGLDGDDADNAEAFVDYAGETCADQLGG